MTYTILPNSGQSLGASRPLINTNFQLIQSVFDQNHIDFDATGAGKHKFVQMPQQGSAAPTAAGDLAIYSKAGTSGSQLYMIRDNTSGTETQLSTAAIAAPIILGNEGATWLPGPATGLTTGCILIQWGQKNIVNGADQTGTITFPTPFRAGTFPFSITFGYAVTGSSSPHNVWIDNPANTTNTSFNYKIDIAGTTVFIYWMAIGLAPT